jgi:DNA-directed RNA polymerase specialized sigma24 family protein
MAAPHRPPPGIPGEDLWLYDAVVGLGRRGLARSSLSVPDREEVLARYVVAAFEGWRTYCPERGTPGQWLLGVLHNQERAFLRERARSDKGAQIVAESTRTVEEASVSRLETLGSL